MGKIKDNLYRCECGREFTKAQSYNAHLSHCKINLGEERYNKRLLQQHAAGIAGRKVQQAKKLNEINNKRIKWNNEIHKCKKCGKVILFDDIIGSGNYCSISCANSRQHSIETLKKISLNSDIHNKLKRSLNGHYKGYYCASSYELIFLIYCLDNNIKIERNKFTFEYEYDNKTHVYIPDWYLPESDTIIECKGMGPNYDEDIVKLKMQSVTGHNYKLLFENDLKEYWNYCKNKFNVNTYKDLCKICYTSFSK